MPAFAGMTGEGEGVPQESVATEVMPESFDKLALWWGPGILLLMGFGYGALRLGHHWIEKVMEVKRQQTEGAFRLVRDHIEQFLSAQQAQAEALSRLAGSVERRDSHDSFEHQEMLIALKAMHRDLSDLPCRGMPSADCPRELPESSRQAAGGRAEE